MANPNEEPQEVISTDAKYAKRTRLMAWVATGVAVATAGFVGVTAYMSK